MAKKERSEQGNRAVRNKRRGRRNEKVLAKEVGGRALGTLGGQDVEVVDKFGNTWHLEAKSRAAFVGVGFLEQAEAHCPDNCIAGVQIHVAGKRRTTDLILMKKTKWMELFFIKK